MRFRVLRSHLGGYVDIPHPLQPGTDGCYMSGTRTEVMANLRRLGVGLVGIRLLEVDSEDQPVTARASA